MTPEVLETMKTISNYFGMETHEVTPMTHLRDKVKVRQIAAYFLVRYEELTLHQVRQILNYRNHTTILFSISQVEALSDTYPAYKEDINNILEQLLKSK